MRLYEINAEIDALIENSTDPDTGELLIDPSVLEALQIEREEEIESLALYIKNLKAEATAIKEEEDVLANRRKVILNKAERLNNLLIDVLGGESFTSPRVEIVYRRSRAVDVQDGFIAWAKIHSPGLLRYQDPEPNKKEIADVLKSGAKVPFAQIVDRANMTIK